MGFGSDSSNHVFLLENLPPICNGVTYYYAGVGLMRFSPLCLPEELRMKVFGEKMMFDVQFFVHIGTLCLCVLLASNKEIN